MGDYSLMLYQPILRGSDFIADISTMAYKWKRSIRLQGGYWLGSFSVIDRPSVCMDFFRTCLGCHLQEHVIGPEPTWEGMIAEMVLDTTPDDEGNGSVDVQLVGYVHTAQWIYSTVSGAANYASEFIKSLIQTDCQFLEYGRIEENTIEVEYKKSINQRVWDEILDIIDKGDSSGNPWRFYVGNDRRAHYHVIDTTPKYFAKGGIKRRRSLLDMENAIVGQYEKSSDGEVGNLTTITNDESISRYGRREGDLIVSDLSEELAQQMQALQLSENAWPWARPENIDIAVLFENEGATVPVNPYLITPAIVRDITYPIGSQEYGSWLTDLRDFCIDEVEVNEDGLVIRGLEDLGLEAFIPRDIMNKSKNNARRERMQRLAARMGVDLHDGHGTPAAGAWSSTANMNAWYAMREGKEGNK